MHRRIKGLLSLTMAVALVTAAVVPVSADELMQPEQQIQEQSDELIEIETQTQQEEAESEPVGEHPTAELVETDLIAELIELETEPIEQKMSEIATETETEQLAAEVEQLIAEVIEAKVVPAEQNAMELELLLDAGSDLDDLYDTLTEDQKKFEVYVGAQPLTELLTDPDAFAKLAGLVGGGVVPDSENLDTQAGTLIKNILETREGDLRFYRLSGWNVWKVDNLGMPQSIIATHSYLSRVATVENFKQAAYLAKGGVATAPATLCSKPILEPIWSCVNYVIPVYRADGTVTEMTVTVNAANYSDIMQVSFPNIEADFWKLIYDDTEYRLNAASELWTNEVNGIRTIGRDFDTSKAKLLAVFETGSTDPEPTEPEPTEPTEPEPTEPEPTEPQPTEPTEPQPTEPTEPQPTEPTEPEPTEPQPTEPEPTEPQDKTAPVISGVSDSVTYFGDQQVKVTDANLRTVTVNGTAVEVLDNEANITLKPSEDVYKIVAEDAAGNRVECTVEVWETWVRDGISENGKKKLRYARLYKLGSGKWTIEGDSTVYEGNKTFYVKNSGEYDFKRK